MKNTTEKMAGLILVLIALSCFWQQIMLGWSIQLISVILFFSLFGFLVMKHYKKTGSSAYASILSAALWIVSVAPQASMLKMCLAILPLIFAISGFKHASIKPIVKFSYVFLFIALHISKYFGENLIVDYVLPGIANLGFYFLVAQGVDIALRRKEDLRIKIVRVIKPLFLFVLPLFYLSLLYLTGMHTLKAFPKQLYFFFTASFNIAALELLFVTYLAYLLQRGEKDKEPILLRLFIALMLESLTISYLIQNIVKFNR
jgi:hypothetical protein